MSKVLEICSLGFHTDRNPNSTKRSEVPAVAL